MTLEYNTMSMLTLFNNHVNTSNGILKIEKDKNKNKELLLVSLLEFVFSQKNENDSLFQGIAEYMCKHKIIDNIDFLSTTYSKIRNKYIDQFKKLLRLNCQNKQIEIYNSRYYNDFEEIKKIASGGYGVVYEVRHKIDGMRYAIKKIPIGWIDECNYSKIVNEVKYLASFNHDNIVRYYSSWVEYIDIDSDDIQDIIDSSQDTSLIQYNGKIQVMFVQMELCKCTLKDHLQDLDDKKVKEIMLDLCYGLQYIHNKGIIHCDLSSKNILVTVDNKVKIADFGLAVSYHNNLEPRCGAQLYIAPEIKKQCGPSFKSDIYSLGIIFFELLVQPKTEMERIRAIDGLKMCIVEDKKWMDLVLQMTNNHPESRPSLDEIIIYLSNQ